MYRSANRGSCIIGYKKTVVLVKNNGGSVRTGLEPSMVVSGGICVPDAEGLELASKWGLNTLRSKTSRARLG
jgi:hypothetical protein